MMEMRNSMLNIVFLMFFIFSLFTYTVVCFQQFYFLIVNLPTILFFDCKSLESKVKGVSFIFSFVYFIHIFQLGSQN